MFRLIDITIDIIFFSINWKNYFDRSILAISMTVLQCTYIVRPVVCCLINVTRKREALLSRVNIYRAAILPINEIEISGQFMKMIYAYGIKCYRTEMKDSKKFLLVNQNRN